MSRYLALPFTYYLIPVSDISFHSFVKCRLDECAVTFKKKYLDRLHIRVSFTVLLEIVSRVLLYMIFLSRIVMSEFVWFFFI